MKIPLTAERPTTPGADSGQHEAAYWLTNKPTIAELRRLNRESFYVFPLLMLDALISAGVDLNQIVSATVQQVPWITDELVAMQWYVVLDGRLIYILRENGECYSVFKPK